MNCKYCGAYVPTGMDTCLACGKSVKEDPYVEVPFCGTIYKCKIIDAYRTLSDYTYRDIRGDIVRLHEGRMCFKVEEIK